MVEKLREVVVDKLAAKQLHEAYNYIRKDSEQNAEKIKNKILASFKDLMSSPEKYPPDKYRLDKNKAFRAYELYKYRITYHIGKDKITIIRIGTQK